MIGKLRTLRQNDDGVAAIEFAIVSVPFLLLIMGIIELGIMFAAGTLLNGATEDAARMIRTGQAQESADAEATFRDRLCGELHALIDCDDLRYQVIRLEDDETFETAFNSPENVFDDIFDPASPDGFSANTFDAGEQNDRIIVRVIYDYPIITPMAGPFFSDGGDDRPGNTRLLVSTAIIQNEPY